MRYVTFQEAADNIAAYSGVAVEPRTIRAMVDDGRLTGHAIGNGLVRVDLDEVERWHIGDGGVPVKAQDGQPRGVTFVTSRRWW